MRTISFTVLGKPQPQGSTKAFVVRGRPRITSDNAKLKPWRQEVGWVALQERPTDSIWAGRHEPVHLYATFYIAPPKKLPNGRVMPAVKPDLDKCIRALNDALTGILWVDDGQVVGVSAKKLYGLPERTEVLLRGLDPVADEDGAKVESFWSNEEGKICEDVQYPMSPEGHE